MRSNFLKIFMMSLILLSLTTTVTGEQRVSGGYDGLPWGAELSQIQKRFPRGSVVKLGDSIIYKQKKPEKRFAYRTFGMKNGRLNMVSLAFDKSYVASRGIVQLLNDQIRVYGEGVVNRERAPHIINRVWENSGTRITFGYAPQRPDMTVLIFENSNAAEPSPLQGNP